VIGWEAGNVPGRYVSPSTGKTVRAVLFDVFGTVVDWRSAITAALRAFATARNLDADPGDLADQWRARYGPAMRRVREGERPFVSLDVLHRENLQEVLAAAGLDVAGLRADDLDALSSAWHLLPPWPDSIAGISQIRQDYIVGPLSNGHTRLLLNMAKASGLPWDLILGADVTCAYKPDPMAYQRPAAFLGLAPGEVMLAAAHNGDLAGARAAGLATAFIIRPDEGGPGKEANLAPAADWDLVATSLTDLARQLR
jgi:2-haloacid dehalogenase